MLVVLDSNVLVSGLTYTESVPGRIVRAWMAGDLQVALSPYILQETMRVLPRLKHSGVSPESAREIVESLAVLSTQVHPADAHEPELRDPADQPILGTLLASGAMYLVSGDKDLLALAPRYPILAPAAFWSRHGADLRSRRP